MLTTCHTIGRPPTSASGLGNSAECSWRRVPRPPHRITTVGRVGGTEADYSGVASGAMSIAPPDIFKAYDIRGLYGSDIDAGLAELIGRAYTQVIAELEDTPSTELRLGLGHDMRLTAPELSEAYLRGMTSEGATVLDGGEI